MEELETRTKIRQRQKTAGRGRGRPPKRVRSSSPEEEEEGEDDDTVINLDAHNSELENQFDKIKFMGNGWTTGLTKFPSNEGCEFSKDDAAYISQLRKCYKALKCEVEKKKAKYRGDSAKLDKQQPNNNDNSSSSSSSTDAPAPAMAKEGGGKSNGPIGAIFASFASLKDALRADS